MSSFKERIGKGWKEVRGNIAVELLKAAGGSSVIIGGLKALSQTLHGTSVDWIFFALLAVLGTVLFATALWKEGGHVRKIETPSAPKAFSDEQWKKLMNSMADITENVKNSFAQSVLLYHFHEEALHLEQVLTSTWHHWDNAGEKLVYPIGNKETEWRAWSIDKCFPLRDEQRDFMVLFDVHLGWLRVEFPGLSTRLLGSGYPSNDEYQVVLANIRDHAKSLKEIADKIRTSEQYMESLDEKS